MGNEAFGLEIAADGAGEIIETPIPGKDGVGRLLLAGHGPLVGFSSLDFAGIPAAFLDGSAKAFLLRGVDEEDLPTEAGEACLVEESGIDDQEGGGCALLVSFPEVLHPARQVLENRGMDDRFEGEPLVGIFEDLLCEKGPIDFS